LAEATFVAVAALAIGLVPPAVDFLAGAFLAAAGLVPPAPAAELFLAVDLTEEEALDADGAVAFFCAGAAFFAEGGAAFFAAVTSTSLAVRPLA
jgi:hypothetical protein